MSDLIDRQATIDAFLTELTKRERKNLLHTWSTVEVKYFITEMLEHLPSAQTDVTDINDGDTISRQAAMRMIYADEFEKRIKPYDTEDSMDKALYNFAHYHLVTTPSAQPMQKRGKWTDNNACPFCGFQPWYERDIHTLSFCPNCGADLRGDNNGNE